MDSTEICQTIDLIFEHHYFHSRLGELLQAHPRTHTDSPYGLLDDQYYKKQQDLVQQIASTVHQLVQAQLRNILTQEFINIGDEIEGIKEEMFKFMEEQSAKTSQLRKEFQALAEEVKRKVTTTQAMSTVVSTGGYTGGIRFMRSGGTSGVQTGQTGQTTSTVVETPSSVHKQMSDLREEVQELKKEIEHAESVKILQEQFNQYKIESKVILESLKHQLKKLEAKTSTPPPDPSSLSPVIKQNIEIAVKRTITSQLKAYASYTQKIVQMRHQIQEFETKLQSQAETQTQYLSNQLKSVWLVFNDMKRIVDDIVDNLGMNSSREML